MDINTMTMEQVEARLAELDPEAEGADLEALSAEMDALEARKKTIIAEAEARDAELRAVAESKKIIKKEENHMEERTFAVNSAEYRDAYMKSLMGLPMAVEERDALTSAASVIPTQTVNKIYGLLEQNDLIKNISALRIPGYVAIPKATLAADANWVAMGTAATDSADTIGSVALSAYKLIKTIEITADIKAMSIDAFEGWLVAKLAQKMEAAICKAILVGTGSSQPTGLIPGATAKVTSISTIAKLSQLMGKLGGAYHRNAVWVMSSDVFYTTIVPLANDKNGVLLMNGVDKMLLGHKVIIDDNCDVTTTSEGSSTTTKNILFGDLNEGYVFNFGEGIAIEADQSVAFRSGSTVYRAMALCDGKPVDANAVVLGTC